MLKILFFGDITGQPGRQAVKQYLPQLMDAEHPDLVLANVENLAHGKGVTVKTLAELLRLGIQGFTSGNHVYSKRELSAIAFQTYADRLVRPMNIPDSYPGLTAIVLPTAKGPVLVGNFLGQVFMENQFHDPISSPFAAFERWLADNQAVPRVATVIDFHAEATSEKIAFGYHLDGKASVLLGTHTHVPTADAKILAGGTGYITDVGMCGAAGSVLGVKKELSLERFLTGNKVSFDIPEAAEQAELSYAIIKIDEYSGRATDIQASHRLVDL